MWHALAPASDVRAEALRAVARRTRPAAALSCSRLHVLPVAARRWFLDRNTFRTLGGTIVYINHVAIYIEMTDGTPSRTRIDQRAQEEEIMRHQCSPSGPALGTYQGEVPLQSRPPLSFASAAPKVPDTPACAVDGVEDTYPGRCQPRYSFNINMVELGHRPDKDEAKILEEVKKEIEKMLAAGFIRPCRYAEWISSIIPVEKKDGRWCVAIDFRDLNRATPKDEYPMPVAETLINAAAGHKVLSFMDGNAGYNQIFMAPKIYTRPHSEYRGGRLV
ncbi:hypothetical protein QYE76_071293 [Lolium multiflorum]|uniref:Uncharacterized protein n=1 Tax=Lolium multiflorum TaxID=4521 RepID=A0AAD8SLE3_LOLMU|nr:hypothetical protein QYE76_071293 [Lolium multiflorum]